MRKNSILSIFLFFAFSISAYAQQITGSVTDEDGIPLPGASVVVEGTSNGVTTNFDGNYSIETSQGDVLIFRFVGYQSQSIIVESSSAINVQLIPNNALSEVIVTALGISREKKSLGYSVSEVSGESINDVKDDNIANSLIGKVAGLQITQSGGIGSGSRITIRGNNSLGGNTQALIVVDGVPINSSGINSGSNDDGGATFRSSISGGGISDINSDDVESISVLKGPTAAALYGSRAGNGVILVTTKKGTNSDKLGVTINSNISVDSPMFLPDYQNEYGHGTLGAAPTDITQLTRSSWGSRLDGSQKLYYNGNRAIPYSAQENNVSDFFRNAIKSISSISLDKASEAGSIRFSYTNNSTESVLENSDLNSHNFNLRGVANLSDKLSVDSKATYFTQEVNNRTFGGGEGILGYVYNMPRNIAVDDLKNYQADNPATPAEFGVIGYAPSTGNPYWMLLNDEENERRNRFIGFSKIDYKFNDWLSAFIRIGADITSVRTRSVEKPGHHFYASGRMSVGELTFSELNTDFLVTANKDLSDKFNIVANIGGNLSKRTSEGLSNSGESFKIPTKFFLSNLNVLNAPVETPLSIKKVNSLYGALSTSYDDFLYLDVSIRNDWSSTLSEDNRSYMYNSASVSALVHRFIDPNQEFFNFIKLRASIAEVGNDTDPYQLTQTFSVPGQGYLGLTTLGSPSVRLNPDLKPETVSSTEFGVELSMLNNKLSLDLSIYDMTTKDLIYNVPVPAATGYSFFKQNIGEVQNKGVEVNLGANLVDNEKFSWNTSLFYSKNENKIIELTEGLESFIYNSSNDGSIAVKAAIDGSIGDLYGTAWATNDSGMVTVDADGKPISTGAQDTYLGNAQPDALFGWSNTISLNDFTLSFLIDARIGGQVYSQTSSEMDAYGVSERSLQYRESGVTVDAYNIGTESTNTQNITAQDYFTSISNMAEFYVYDQDNVRLRELAIGYDIQNTQTFGIDSARLQLIGRNLFFFSKSADDIDPESMVGTTLGTQGISVNAMPTLKSVGLNLTLNF